MAKPWEFSLTVLTPPFKQATFYTFCLLLRQGRQVLRRILLNQGLGWCLLDGMLASPVHAVRAWPNAVPEAVLCGVRHQGGAEARGRLCGQIAQHRLNGVANIFPGVAQKTHHASTGAFFQRDVLVCLRDFVRRRPIVRCQRFCACPSPSM